MTASRFRVGFAGTPEFAAVALERILDAGFAVPLVLTQPDRPAGRGLKLSPSAVKQVAVGEQIPVQQPHSLRLEGKYPDEAAAAQAALQAAELDVLVVAAYGLILPKWVLEMPRLGCLNIHASLLPRWRGAAPIHRAIEAGDAQTGITIMQMDEGLDTGDMLLRESCAIDDHHSTALLHDELAAMGGRLIVQALQRLASGETLQARPQPQEGVNYAHKIDKAEAAIDWTQSARQLAQRVRAFDPFPGASFRCGEELVKLWQAEVVPGRSGEPGEVLAVDAQSVTVACGQDALRLLAVQRPGGRRGPVGPWLQASQLKPGMRLS